MARKDRTGNRKTREQRKQYRSYGALLLYRASSGIDGGCEKQACNKGGRDKDSCYD